MVCGRPEFESPVRPYAFSSLVMTLFIILQNDYDDGDDDEIKFNSSPPRDCIICGVDWIICVLFVKQHKNYEVLQWISLDLANETSEFNCQVQ